MTKVLRLLSVCVYLASTVSVDALDAQRPYRATREWGKNLDRIDHNGDVASEARRLIYGTIFPVVSFNHIACDEALSWVLHHMNQHNAEHASAGMFLGHNTHLKRRISLHLHSVSMPQVMDAVCTRSDCYWHVGKFALVILDKASFLKSEKIVEDEKLRMQRADKHP